MQNNAQDPINVGGDSDILLVNHVASSINQGVMTGNVRATASLSSSQEQATINSGPSGIPLNTPPRCKSPGCKFADRPHAHLQQVDQPVPSSMMLPWMDGVKSVLDKVCKDMNTIGKFLSEQRHRIEKITETQLELKETVAKLVKASEERPSKKRRIGDVEENPQPLPQTNSNGPAPSRINLMVRPIMTVPPQGLQRTGFVSGTGAYRISGPDKKFELEDGSLLTPDFASVTYTRPEGASKLNILYAITKGPKFGYKIAGRALLGDGFTKRHIMAGADHPPLQLMEFKDFNVFLFREDGNYVFHNVIKVAAKPELIEKIRNASDRMHMGSGTITPVCANTVGIGQVLGMSINKYMHMINGNIDMFLDLFHVVISVLAILSIIAYSVVMSLPASDDPEAELNVVNTPILTDPLVAVLDLYPLNSLSPVRYNSRQGGIIEWYVSPFNLFSSEWLFCTKFRYMPYHHFVGGCPVYEFEFSSHSDEIITYFVENHDLTEDRAVMNLLQLICDVVEEYDDSWDFHKDCYPRTSFESGFVGFNYVPYSNCPGLDDYAPYVEVSYPTIDSRADTEAGIRLLALEGLNISACDSPFAIMAEFYTQRVEFLSSALVNNSINFDNNHHMHATNGNHRGSRSPQPRPTPPANLQTVNINPPRQVQGQLPALQDRAKSVRATAESNLRIKSKEKKNARGKMGGNNGHKAAVGQLVSQLQDVSADLAGTRDALKAKAAEVREVREEVKESMDMKKEEAKALEKAIKDSEEADKKIRSEAYFTKMFGGFLHREWSFDRNPTHTYYWHWLTFVLSASILIHHMSIMDVNPRFLDDLVHVDTNCGEKLMCEERQVPVSMGWGLQWLPVLEERFNYKINEYMNVHCTETLGVKYCRYKGVLVVNYKFRDSILYEFEWLALVTLIISMLLLSEDNKMIERHRIVEICGVGHRYDPRTHAPRDLRPDLNSLNEIKHENPGYGVVEVSICRKHFSLIDLVFRILGIRKNKRRKQLVSLELLSQLLCAPVFAMNVDDETLWLKVNTVTKTLHTINDNRFVYFEDMHLGSIRLSWLMLSLENNALRCRSWIFHCQRNSKAEVGRCRLSRR